MSEKDIAQASTGIVLERSRRPGKQGPVPALTVVSHPVVARVGDRCLLRELRAGKTVALSRNAPDFSRPGSALGLPLADPFLSRKPITFAPTGQGGVRVSVARGGTRVWAGEPIQDSRDFSPEALAEGVPLELGGRLVLLLHLASAEAGEPVDRLGLVGTSAGMMRVRGDIERVADLDVSVLIRGGTGTGKELVARAIHDQSTRRDGPFVGVNLGAIPTELAAAELFGSARGAYTGAVRDRGGFFQAAQGGTLFLDEVGEASLRVQSMLLRALETGEVYAVGSQRPARPDIRILAATDADLEEQVGAGQFKEPLLHRLGGYEIWLPTLRERREDIGLLFYHFACEELARIGEAHRLASEDPHAEPWLPAALAARLVSHPWPGNVRQLRNVTRQLVIGSRGHAQVQIVNPRLERALEGEAPDSGQPAEPGTRPRRSRRKVKDITEPELRQALRASSWDLTAAADQLGIARSSIYDLIRQIPGLRTAGELGTDEIARCFDECHGDLDAMVERLQVSRRALLRRIRELGLAGPDA